MCIYECLYRCTHTQTMKVLDWVPGECEILDFFSQRAVSDTPPSLHCLGSFTSSEYLHIKLLLIYKLCALLQICALTNACVDKHHLLLQKGFEKTGTFTIPSLATSWPCLLPDSRKAKPSSAWLKGAAKCWLWQKDFTWLIFGVYFLVCLFCLNILSGSMKTCSLYF